MVLKFGTLFGLLGEKHPHFAELDTALNVSAIAILKTCYIQWEYI